MFSLRDFWRRHKRKVLATAGVVGSGYCLYKVYNAYKNQLADMERRLADEREHDELVKAQMQSHFEIIQRIADTVTLPHSISYLNNRITEELDHSYITEALQRGKGQPASLTTAEKLELWDKLKIISFTRMTVSLWAVTLLSLYVRVQVNILGRHLYIDIARGLEISFMPEDADLIDRDDQQKFLASADYLPHSGLLLLANDIQAAATEVLKGKQLKDLFDVTALRETVMHISDTFISTESSGKWVDYLMPGDTKLHKDAIVSTGSDTFHSDLTKFDQLMLETREVILSPEFGRVVEVSLKQLVSALVEDFESVESSLTSSVGMPLAKLLPRVAQMGSLLLKEPSENRYVQIMQGLPDVELFFTLLATKESICTNSRGSGLYKASLQYAGKSTISGHILVLSGQVDDRTIHKYEKEAKDNSRESWYMAYVMDTNEEERLKGKTVEVARADFETETTRFTILDAPGHKNYVSNMIGGASQADIGVLVISARKGEFETGYERGGQTREHVQLAKTFGVTKLLVVVNKMDDPTVNWSEERYEEIKSKMAPFLKSSGYNVKKDVIFLPLSGLMGANIKTRMDKSICSWWNGPSLLEALDRIEVPLGDPNGPFRMRIIDKIKIKDMGTVFMGKVESGSVTEGDSLMLMPNKTHVRVIGIYIDDNDDNRVMHAGPGENLRVRLSGIDDEASVPILSGFVLSSVENPIAGVTEFIAQLQICELNNAMFTAGYQAVMHIHSAVEECEVTELIQQIDPRTKEPMKRKPFFVKDDAIIVCRIQVSSVICMERYSDLPQLGRFTLRSSEGKTVAVGKVTALPSSSA
ncbi:Eukaryotic peptide chain release factor GTP-binding subunit ERF3A [Linum grandiflorum]